MMTPSRTGGTKGRLQLDRIFPELRRYPARNGRTHVDLGRIRLSAGTLKLARFRAFDAMLTTLADEGAWEVLAAIRDRVVTLAAVADARRHGRPVDLHRITPWWPAVDEALQAMGAERDTVARYRTSLQKLRTVWPSITLGELASADWRSVRPLYRSPSDHNHLRRAVSAVLTRLVGVASPLRQAVLAAIPLEKERKRTPRVDGERARWLLATAPDDIRATVMVLALTGARVGELGAAMRDAQHARRATCTIVCPAGKTGAHEYAVAPAAWPWVESAFTLRFAPAPKPEERVSDSIWARRLARRWSQHTAAAGDRLTLHDLRHVHAQIAVDEGVPERDVQEQLGHRTPGQTRTYTARVGQRTSAEAVARVLLRSGDQSGDDTRVRRARTG